MGVSNLLAVRGDAQPELGSVLIFLDSNTLCAIQEKMDVESAVHVEGPYVGKAFDPLVKMAGDIPQRLSRWSQFEACVPGKLSGQFLLAGPS